MLSPSWHHLKKCLASLALLYGLLDQRHLLHGLGQVISPSYASVYPAITCLSYLLSLDWKSPRQAFSLWVSVQLQPLCPAMLQILPLTIDVNAVCIVLGKTKVLVIRPLSTASDTLKSQRDGETTLFIGARVKFVRIHTTEVLLLLYLMFKWIIQLHSCWFLPSTLCKQSPMPFDRKVKFRLSTFQTEVSSGWEQEVQKGRSQNCITSWFHFKYTCRIKPSSTIKIN